MENLSETLIINGTWYHIVHSPYDGGFYAEDINFKATEIYTKKGDLIESISTNKADFHDE